MRAFTSVACALVLFAGAGCKTKRDLRREQEYERIKAEVKEARGTRADLDTISEELRTEVTRLATTVDEQGQLVRMQNDELRKELQALAAKVQTLEQQLAAATAPPPTPAKKPSSYDIAKSLFEEERFEEAIEEAKAVMKAKKNSADVRKAQFLLAESYFASHDYSAAALEYLEFKKSYPKDPGLPQATLRQAQCFKNLNKDKEAKLFYQEVIEKYPKSPSAAQAKKEMKKLK